jgi:hypothetical protein
MQQNGAQKLGCPVLHPRGYNDEEFYLRAYNAE